MYDRRKGSSDRQEPRSTHQSNQRNNNHDITSPLEGMTLRNDQIHGGSGFASATVADLGFEPTDGATHTATGGGVSGGKRARAQAKSVAGISGGAFLTEMPVRSCDLNHRQGWKPGLH